MASAATGGEPAAGRGYWRWSKADFFPEPSFQSWRAYGKALLSTAPRLRDRVTSRSSDAVEAGTLLAQSENPLRRCLSWVDLAFLGFGSVVGSGVFVLTGQEARFDAGPAIPLAYAAAGFSALLSSFCYAEFATEIPSAGGSFSYLRVELGDLAAFIAAGNILLEAVVGAAGLGRSWTSYLAALIGRDSDALRIHVPALADGFNMLDPIAVIVLCTTSALAVSSARLTSTINSLASVVGIAIIAFVLLRARVLRGKASKTTTQERRYDWTLAKLTEVLETNNVVTFRCYIAKMQSFDGASSRQEREDRGEARHLGEEMEMAPSSRSVLSSCNRLAARAPWRRTASAGATRKEKGVVCILNGEEKDVVQKRIRRRAAFSLLLASPALSVAFSAYGKSKTMNPYDERRLLQQNKKIQEANRAPEDFPNFIREGFQVKVVTSDNYITRDSGLMYEDIKVGTGDSPKDGQQIIFHYVGYNEAGRRIDSTYIQGSPAKIRLGNGTLVPGFEEGIRDMKPGGKRRMIIPPELGPPVGPSTFFSAKQFEVFDVELLAVQDCQRRTIAFYSDVVCS